MTTLIYDGDCKYCKTFAETIKRTTEVKILDLHSDEAQSKIRKEFEEPGYTMYFFEEDRISFGNKAAERITQKLFPTKILPKIVLKTYPGIEKIVSILTKRRKVTQPSCTDKCSIITEKGGVKQL